MTSVINNKMAPQDGNEIDFGRLVGEVIDGDAANLLI